MRTWYLVVSVALSAFVCCGTVQAQGDDGRQGQERPPGDLVRQLRQRLLERFDENGNGRLDRREGRHAIEVLRGVVERHRGRLIHLSTLPAGLRSILALFDRNKDGVLDPMEMRILKRALPRVTRPPQRPERPGAEEARPDRPARPAPPAGGDSRPPSLTPELVHRLRQLLLRAFDRNDNQRLDLPERRHAHTAVAGFLARHRGRKITIESAPANLRGILALFDRNRDGELGPVERILLHRALHVVLRPRQEPPRRGDKDRSRPPRFDRPSLDDELDRSRPERPTGGDGFEVRPGGTVRPDF